MEINRIFNQNKAREVILEELCRHLRKKYELKAYFCSISGMRWAFLAGCRDVDIPRQRIALNSNTGLVVEKISHLDPEQWNEIMKTIKSNFLKTPL